MPAPNGRRVMTASPNTGRDNVRIDAEKYDALRNAILRVLPARPPGLEFKKLPDAVRAHLPGGKIPGGGSLRWYTTVVKLDLEVRGEIERVEGASPQRLVRKRTGG